ncbi:putative sec1-like protein [Plasmopara halstedii]
MSSVVNLAEEVLNGVLQAAEHLRGAIIAAENGCIESLRWSGAMPLLLRDFGVQNNYVTYCFTRDRNCGSCSVITIRFSLELRKSIKRLLTLDVIHRLTICSSISEKAHECYDFSKAENNMKDSAMELKFLKK